MGRPSKKTPAETAVKAALEAAQAYADAEENSAGAADALTLADEALVAAEAAVADAGLNDEFAAALESARVMIGVELPEGPPEPEPEPEPEPVIDYHTIAPGKAITSKRGILGPGERINIDDLPDGAKALRAFVKSGHVLKPAG